MASSGGAQPAAPRGRWGGASPPPHADADGFITIGSGGRAGAPRPTPAQPPAEAEGSASAMAEAALPSEERVDGMQEEATHGDGAEYDGDQPSADGEPQPTADQLKAAWHKAQKVDELLAEQGLAEDDPVREAARARAEAAKRLWADARPGVGVSKRLVYAEQALLRARRSQSKMEQSIDDLDMEYEAERARRTQALHELRGRTQQREQFLAELSRQAAEEFRGGGEGGGGGARGARRAVETMEGPIRDAMQEAHDAAPEGSDLRVRLAGALGALGELSTSMAQAPGCRWADADPQCFDLDGGRGEDDWWGDHGDFGAQWYSNAWGGGPAEGRDGGGARWDDDMDTAEVAVPSWLDAPQREDRAEAGYSRTPKHRRRDGEDDDGVQGRHVGEDGVPRDHAQAARLQAAVSDAARGALATPAPPTPNLAEMALEAKRREIWDLAQEQGAQISYEEVTTMSMGQLDDWKAACLL